MLKKFLYHALSAVEIAADGVDQASKEKHSINEHLADCLVNSDGSEPEHGDIPILRKHEGINTKE